MFWCRQQCMTPAPSCSPKQSLSEDRTNFRAENEQFMNRIPILAFGCMLILATVAQSQEVVVTGFPLGQGSNVEADFFEPYRSQLQNIADTLSKYPLAQAIVTGGADGQKYRRNDDAQNPSLALGRAHALRNLLVEKFDVDAGSLLVKDC